MNEFLWFISSVYPYAENKLSVPRPNEKNFSTVDQLTNTDQSDWLADSTFPVCLVGFNQLIDRTSLLRSVEELKVCSQNPSQ
jgi:hypothetical protein